MIAAYLSTLLHDTIALITILNPIAAAGIMISMINPPTPATIYPAAGKATLTVLIASLVTLFTGEFLFKLFGINVYSIKVIGGIILMMIAINMASGQSTKSRHTPEEHEEAQEKEDISINVDDNVLTISGERKIEEERKDEEFYRVESVYGKFERSFTLPEDVDADKIEAEVKDGVLTIRIPKAQVVEKAPKKIEIK